MSINTMIFIGWACLFVALGLLTKAWIAFLSFGLFMLVIGVYNKSRT
uniref:Uncharacterized protein n=1 Tax=viral metagenome TaxID=1070528 RepID=A0A6M3JJC2_9ZZZZ